MTTYFMKKNAKITAETEVIASTRLTTEEMQEMERMDASKLIEYAEAVPSWDYVEEGMWAYIAYWCGLDMGEDEEWDPEAFLDEARAVLAARAA